MPSAVAGDDAEVLRALGKGDRNAVAILYERYGAKMVGYARRYTPDDGSAEDVVLGLLGRWIERPPSVRDVRRLSAFLATSIYHAAVDWVRRDRTEQGQPPRRAAGEEPAQRQLARAPLPELPADELAPRLAAALGRLSKDDLLVLESHYGQALSAAECASLLGISVDAFHQRLHRARLRLARLIDRSDLSKQRGERDAR